MGKLTKKSKFFYWLRKSRKVYPILEEIYADPEINSDSETKALEEAAYWKKLGCPYEQALALFEGSEVNKKEALAIIHELGADAVYEK